MWAVMNPHVDSFFRSVLKSRLVTAIMAPTDSIAFAVNIMKTNISQKMRTESILHVMEALTHTALWLTLESKPSRISVFHIIERVQKSFWNLLKLSNKSKLNVSRPVVSDSLRPHGL